MPPGGVIDTFLRDSGCNCQPELVSRHTDYGPEGIPVGGFGLRGLECIADGKPVELRSMGFSESVLAHAETCPLYQEDPFST